MTAPGFQIAAIGEVLWDLLPTGKQLGGAPANFICHAHALSANARLISRVGDDALGREIMASFRARGLPTEGIAVDASTPTGTVSVKVGAGGQPRYIIHEDVAWDRIEPDNAALETVRNADAVCFGSLAQRTKLAKASVATLLAATRADALRIFDINLRHPFIDREVLAQSLAAANVLKLNEQELPVLAELFHLSGDLAQQLAALAERFSLRLVAFTCGGDGSVLCAGGRIVKFAAVATTVHDTVGAGDSFTAAVTSGLLRNWPLEQIGLHASAIAAYVCSQTGATPPLPATLRQPFVETACPVTN